MSRKKKPLVVKDKDIDELHTKLNDLKYYNQYGKTYKAEALLMELLYDYPNEPRVVFEYALSLWRKGGESNVLKSLDILKDLISLNSFERVSYIYEYIKISIYSNNIADDIEEYFEELIGQSYRLGQVEYYYGKYCEKLGRNSDAKIHYQRSSNEGYNKASTALANLVFKTETDSYNNRDVLKIYKNEKITLDDLFVKVRVLLKKKRVLDVYTLLKKTEQLLTLRHRNAANIFFMFKTYIEIGKVDDAERIYENNKECLKFEWNIDFFEARLDLCKNNLSKAKEKYIKILGYNKEYLFDSCYFLSKIAYLEDNVEEEKYYLEQAINYNKDIGTYNLALFYMRHNNYEEARELINSIGEDYFNSNIHHMRQIQVILGIPIPSEYSSYTINQLKNYDRDLAYEHIKFHQEGVEYNSFFKKDIDINELMMDAISKIQNMKPGYYDVFEHYIIECPNCGEINEENLDYYKVLIIPGTKNIITMYPVANNNPFAENYIVKDKKEIYLKKEKVKRKSQIDKFNERYNR